MNILGKFKYRQILLRSHELKATDKIHDYSIVSYYDFTSNRIGCCNSEFNFVLGTCFVI